MELIEWHESCRAIIAVPLSLLFRVKLRSTCQGQVWTLLSELFTRRCPVLGLLPWDRNGLRRWSWLMFQMCAIALSYDIHGCKAGRSLIVVKL